MLRRYIDCRTAPSENNCTVEIAADTEDEVLELAVMHAVQAHKHQDTPEFRREIRSAIRTRDEALT
jgi:predicted small metal-binding protein